jgi:hypothetical protein
LVEHSHLKQHFFSKTKKELKILCVSMATGAGEPKFSEPISVKTKAADTKWLVIHLEKEQSL